MPPYKRKIQGVKGGGVPPLLDIVEVVDNRKVLRGNRSECR